MEGLLPRRERLIDFLAPVDTKIGLDVGCGLGVETKDISRLGGTCLGCDLDPEILRIARQEDGKGSVFVCATAEALPFKDLAFDYILAFDILEHIVLDELFLSELSRIIRPSGTFMLNVPNGWGPWELYRRLALFALNLFRKISRREMEFWPHEQAHVHFYNLFTLRRMLRRNNLIPSRFFTANVFMAHVIFVPVWYFQILIHKCNDEARLRLWANTVHSQAYCLVKKLDEILFNRILFFFNSSFIFVCKKSA